MILKWFDTGLMTLFIGDILACLPGSGLSTSEARIYPPQDTWHNANS
jgi:hypothetical protein